MKTNLEYIRAFFGERGESQPLFTDDELVTIMKGHLIHQMSSSLARELARSGVSYRVADDTCFLLLTLKKDNDVSPNLEEYYAGIGHWQDGATMLLISESGHELGPGESVDTLHGRVTLVGPVAEGAEVMALVHLVDMRAVLIELTRILKASRARLAVKAQLAGVNVDLSQVSRRLEEEIVDLTTSYELPFNLPEDFPH